MDSMRHLSTSLPNAKRGEPSDILADFRAAALSVTTLYKNATKAQDRARTAGYQDALDDLLSFLDKDSLGLMDGEGWKVRQWATSRLEGEKSTGRPGGGADGMADDDDDNSTSKDEDKDEERSSSPEVERKRTHQLAPLTSEVAEEEYKQHRRVVSEPPQPPSQQAAPMQSDFTFQSPHPYPTNHYREGKDGMDLDGSATPHHQTQTSSTPSSTETVRFIRSSKANRHINRRNDNRLPTINFNLGTGAGSKRKMPYPEFFDITGFNNGNEGGDRKDGGGRGGKRGRHA